MSFYAYLKQCGGGCDYTIGCGLKMIKLKSKSYPGALVELRQIIREEYTGDRKIESLRLIEGGEHAVNLEAMYKGID